VCVKRKGEEEGDSDRVKLEGKERKSKGNCEEKRDSDRVKLEEQGKV